MKKSKKWYEGNTGLLTGRSRLEARQAGEHNPQNKTVCCKSCGRDTNDTGMLCDKCGGYSDIEP
jgi:hypothetical protein